jgi:hypothetical protein
VGQSQNPPGTYPDVECSILLGLSLSSCRRGAVQIEGLSNRLDSPLLWPLSVLEPFAGDMTAGIKSVLTKLTRFLNATSLLQ